MKTQTGKLIAGCFDENTLTIRVDNLDVITPGEYALVPIKTYKHLYAYEEKCLLERSMEALDNYLNAGNKEMRKENELHGIEFRKWKYERTP